MSFVLGRSASLLRHRLRDVSLVATSLFFLPLSIFILVSSYVVSRILQSPTENKRRLTRRWTGFKPKTVLVTGVEMSKGLSLARMFYETGHDVIGAGFSRYACGKHSKAVRKFYHLRKPTSSQGSTLYIQDLIDIIVENEVELWVSCSGVASAVEDGQAKELIEARTTCKAIQFNVTDTQMLHEKHTFIENTASIGLDIPETHTITSQAQAEKILRETVLGRKFIMKPVGMVDSARSDMTLLPLSSMQATENYLSQREISIKSRWILQQYINGLEYCTHALVIKGQVKAFVSCPSADILMHYETLPTDSALNQKMLTFTKAYTNASGKEFTGHLSFDFMVEREALKHPETMDLHPIECNPRAHTAVALFKDDAAAMVEAYMSLFAPDNTQQSRLKEPAEPKKLKKCYWVGHDLFEFVILPALSLVLLRASLLDLYRGLKTFTTHVLLWTDATYELWDPLPFFWLYHVYWPMQFWSTFKDGRRWSRMNVSTGKMFEC